MALLDRIRTQHQRMTAPKPKAITAHRPDLADRVHMSSSNSGTWAEPIQDSFVDYANVYGVYVWVRKAIDKIAQNISTLPIEVLDKDGTAIPSHELAILLGKGNDAMPAPVLWETWVSNMMLSGEGPIEIVPDRRGRPSELWPRRPDLTLVQPDVSPERRNYPAVAGYVVMPDGAQVDTLYLAPDAMIFDKFYNPLSPWRGLSPISAIRNSITIDMFAQSWSKAFLKGGARPDYAVMAPQGLTKTERDNIQAEMMYQFGGAQNAGKPIVLESGATDIKPFSWAPKDIEWLSQREFSRDEVAALFGVPDEIMGFGRDTFENLGTAFEVFWKLTLRPLITHRDMVLTHFFTMRRPMLLPGQRIATDLTSVGVLHDDKTGSWRAIQPVG
jgi:HK97 family phage portal protein